MSAIRRAVGGIAVATSALLSACGGGGDGGGESASQASGDLTAANYAARADALMFSMTGGDEAAQGLEQRLGVLDQVSDSGTVPCTGGGSWVVTLNAASPDRDSVGDKVTLSSRNCVEGGLPVTGSLEGVLLAVTDTSERYYAKVSLKANALGSSQLRVDGPATVEFDERANRQSFKLSFEGMTVATPGKTASLQHGYEYVREGSSSTLAMNGLVHADGQSYLLRQKTPFALSPSTGWPQGGAVEVIDKDGDRVEVRAAGDRFTYTFYPAGSSTAAAGPSDGPRFSEL